MATVQQFHILPRHLIPGAKPYAYVLRIELHTRDLAGTLAKIRALRDDGRILRGAELEARYGEGTFVPIGPRIAGAGRPAPGARPYAVLFFTNPRPGRQAEYQSWYEAQEIPALLRQPGVVSARRYTLADQQLRDPRPAHAYQFMILLEVRSADIDSTLSGLAAAQAGGRILNGPALAPTMGDGTFEPVSPVFSR